MIILFLYISFILQLMKAQDINQMFLQQRWNNQIDAKYRIPTRVIHLSETQIQYLTSDDTNPNLSQFSPAEQLTAIIKQLGGAVFAKVANRSAKDCSNLERKIMNTKALVMLIKLSEYLTQALCQESNESTIILRHYLDELQSGNDQFRVYILQGRLVGICQKVTSFLGAAPTLNQLSAINICKCQIQESIFEKQQSFVMDLYCSPNGKDIKIMAIQPFYIHPLSLFTQQELKNHFQMKKTKAIVKIVSKESQLKDIDLSEYRPGCELKHLENVKQWVNFMEHKNKEQDQN